LKTRRAGIRATWVVGLLASSLVIGPPAFAQKKPKPTATADAAGGAVDKKKLAEAKKHYGDGDTKFKAGDYAGALDDFKAADDIKATPQTARFIGICLDNLGRFPEAIDAYNRFLANVPPKMTAQGDEIKARVAAIQLLPGKLHVSSDPIGIGFLLDGKLQAMPTPADVDVPPGHHTLHFTAAGHDPIDKDVDVTFASKQDVTVALPLSAAPPPPPPVAVAPPPPEAGPGPVVVVAAPQPHSITAAVITGAAAIVAVGIGTTFGILALNDKSNFNNDPTTATADSGENHALIADMSFGVAITLGVTSLVLLLSRDDVAPVAAAATASATPRKRDAKRLTLPFSIEPSPIVTSHGAGAGALIRF
jgi:PEGA domain